jgi:hypothetical protein
MTAVYRISKSPDIGEILDSVEALQAFARDYTPGRHDVNEHSLDQFRGSKVSASARGKVIDRHDHQVDLKIDRWPAVT